MSSGHRTLIGNWCEDRFNNAKNTHDRIIAHTADDRKNRFVTTNAMSYPQYFTTSNELKETQKMPPFQHCAKYPRNNTLSSYHSGVGAWNHQSNDITSMTHGSSQHEDLTFKY